MREVSEYLGNTPAVARASYVDPRVIDLYHDGVTVPAALASGAAGSGSAGSASRAAGRAPRDRQVAPDGRQAAEDAVVALLRDA